MREEGSNASRTKEIPEGSRIAGIPITGDADGHLRLHRASPSLAGFAYWFLLNRTRFGFDLRATGRSDDRGRRQRHQRQRMVVIAMLLSGAIAGLVGLPILFGDGVLLRLDVPVRPGLRRHRGRPAGPQPPDRHRLRRGAVRLPRRAVQPAQILVGVSPDIVAITQGVIVLTVVISYEVVRRYGVRIEQRRGRPELQSSEARAGRGGARMSVPTTGAPTPTTPPRPPPPHHLVAHRGRCSSRCCSRCRSSGRHRRRRPRPRRGTIAATLIATVPDHARRRSAACGPSAPASSTSASRG